MKANRVQKFATHILMALAITSASAQTYWTGTNVFRGNVDVGQNANYPGNLTIFGRTTGLNFFINGKNPVLWSGTITQGITYSPGAGTHMYWYPYKAAFRAGWTSGLWNDGSVGYYSVAMGADPVASGNASIALGNGTRASGLSQTVVGSFNESSGNPTAWVETDPVFIVGNGRSDSARSNAFTVYKDGTILMKKAQGDISMGQFGTQP